MATECQNSCSINKLDDDCKKLYGPTSHPRSVVRGRLPILPQPDWIMASPKGEYFMHFYHFYQFLICLGSWMYDVEVVLEASINISKCEPLVV